jgi:hypothetical protein
MGRTCSVHGAMRNLYKILVEHSGDCTLRRSRRIWDDSVKMHLKNRVLGRVLCSTDSG